MIYTYMHAKVLCYIIHMTHQPRFFRWQITQQHFNSISSVYDASWFSSFINFLTKTNSIVLSYIIFWCSVSIVNNHQCLVNLLILKSVSIWEKFTHTGVWFWL